MARKFREEFLGFGNSMDSWDINAQSAPPRTDRRPTDTSSQCRDEWLALSASSQARSWSAHNGRKCKFLHKRWKKASESIRRAIQSVGKLAHAGQRLCEDERWILENARLLLAVSADIRNALKTTREVPLTRSPQDSCEAVPRVYRLAAEVLQTIGFEFNEGTLRVYLSGVQQVVSLEMRELWALKPMLQYVLLECVAAVSDVILNSSTERNADENSRSPGTSPSAATAIASLRAISEADWREVFEANSLVDHILRTDPSGAYPKMDFESRQLYRDVVSDLAPQSRLSEADIARRTVLLAQKAKTRKAKRSLGPRAIERRSHVGYYLIDVGTRILKRSIGYRPLLRNRIREAILEWPELYYVVGVEFTTLILVLGFLLHLGIIIPLIPGLLLLIPASQAAVGLMNHLTAFLLPPRRIPKLDFSTGVPPEFSTLVVVPSLLLSEKEVRHIVEALEVRYLSNRDPNLHFALLTDFPDASKAHDQHDELVELCSSLIAQLNAKYGCDHQGSFFHFHRRRVYNPQENTWMGWERKRGKLLDLNKLLRNGVDNFPVKVGELSVLPRIRYVITLDSDTRLPRDTTHRLIGSLAHPLNRAVIDRETNTVVEGYGILQPRVGISIESARTSRLASIYSGETGYDIYTRAVSDVYQDLFGEGSFAGKGIYEVDTFQQVLGNRFPSNALLSHDLIEGAYARAGLTSDVEVIDDYPSHFSAYCRRMHRWVRGDWQILRWLFPRVPDFFGRLVANPLTLLSRWKIFDNLRRSLIEVDLFLLLLGGWFLLSGGPLYWTLVTLALLLVPTYFQLFFSLLRINRVQNRKGFIKEQANNFVMGHLQIFVTLIFLAHRAAVMVDAIVRTLTRLVVTHRNLLEWETAAEAEMGTNKKTPVEVYLAFTPWFALATGLALAGVHPNALVIASPILLLWMLAGMFTKWINRPPGGRRSQLSAQDEFFLRLAGLRTWRFFREFCNSRTRWLVPDRVQETPAAVLHTISPTNLGLLLNVRIAAYHLGYLTLEEFIEETERTIDSMKRLPRFRGHFFNWYNAQALKPLSPRFISTVDSGNLGACLWTLKQACLGLLNEPLFARGTWQGIRDHIALVLQLSREDNCPEELVCAIEKLAQTAESVGEDSLAWINSLTCLKNAAREVVAFLHATSVHPGKSQQAPADGVAFWASETLVRIERTHELADLFVLWLQPQCDGAQFLRSLDHLALNSLPSFIADVQRELDLVPPASGKVDGAKRIWPLRSHVAICLRKANEFCEKLRRLAAEAEELMEEMDFRFLYDFKRKLFSVGYDADAQRLEKSYYDLVASEARIANFIAIAKGDIKQEAWFHLGRSRTLEQGEMVLSSWSGTMFEYLMPLLWMRSYSGTLLDQSMCAVVACQQRFTKKKGIPWGISESAFNALDEKGIYQYRAFGLPDLALDPNASSDMVIAPYASFLALPIDAVSAVRNLQKMQANGWLGRFGFYESADYTAAERPGSTSYKLIRCWMAHHQGMSLLAVCNLLSGHSLQEWFHQEPQVIATELLLHERVPLAAPEETSPMLRWKYSQPSAWKRGASV